MKLSQYLFMMFCYSSFTYQKAMDANKHNQLLISPSITFYAREMLSPRTPRSTPRSYSQQIANKHRSVPITPQSRKLTTRPHASSAPAEPSTLSRQHKLVKYPIITLDSIDNNKKTLDKLNPIV